MRKITREAVAAFMGGYDFRSSNTEVLVSEDTGAVTLFLHGNAIARRDSNGLRVSNGGWSSNTTKERLNGIPGVSVAQRNFEWFLNGRPWDGSWTLV